MPTSDPEARSVVPHELTMKITLAGDPSVGKSSLVKRFVSNTFDDRYAVTLGVKVSSKKFSVEDPNQPGTRREVLAGIWDLMGHVGIREVLREAYFHGVKGVLLVCDGTRPPTLDSLRGWSKAVGSVAGLVPSVVLVNKSDLKDDLRVRPDGADKFCKENGWRWLPTSAKTGENVDAAFTLLARLYLTSLGKP